MSGLELLTDALFLPLSFHASLSDIRKRALPSYMELMLLACGFSMILGRAFYYGIDDLCAIFIHNAVPLVLLLMSAFFRKTGFGDFEYTLSMALFYPDKCEVTSFNPIRGIYEPLRISASTISIALLNAILIAWLIAFSMGVLKWSREHRYPSKAALIATLAILVPIPRALLLTPLFSKLTYPSGPQTIELPLIPLIFVGFLAARFAQTVLL